MSYNDIFSEDLEQICRQLQAKLSLTYSKYGNQAGNQLVVLCQPATSAEHDRTFYNAYN